MRPLYATRLAGSPWMHRCPGCGFCAAHPLGDEITAAYDDAYTASDEAGRKNRLLAPDYFAKIEPHLPVPPFRFLEVGGSHGWLAQRVHDETGAEVHLLEPGRTAVVAAASRGLQAEAGYLEAFVTGNPFDVVFAAHVIEHVVDVGRFLAAAHRVLRPGGTLLLLTPNADAWKFAWAGAGWAWAAPGEHTHLLNANSAAHLLTRHGFEPRTIHARVAGWPCYPYFFARWMAENGVPRPVRLPLVTIERAVLAVPDALMGQSRLDELLIVAERR